MLLSTKVCKCLHSTNGRFLSIITTYNVSYTVITLTQICYIITILNAISDQIGIPNFGVSVFHTFTAVTITLLHTKWDAEFRGPSILHHFSLLYNYCIRVSFTGHTTICCYVLPVPENTSQVNSSVCYGSNFKNQAQFYHRGAYYKHKILCTLSSLKP